MAYLSDVLLYPIHAKSSNDEPQLQRTKSATQSYAPVLHKNRFSVIEDKEGEEEGGIEEEE